MQVGSSREAGREVRGERGRQERKEGEGEGERKGGREGEGEPDQGLCAFGRDEVHGTEHRFREIRPAVTQPLQYTRVIAREVRAGEEDHRGERVRAET
eukprot:2722673-Rhodomonas_salina.1